MPNAPHNFLTITVNQDALHPTEFCRCLCAPLLCVPHNFAQCAAAIKFQSAKDLPVDAEIPPTTWLDTFLGFLK